MADIRVCFTKLGNLQYISHLDLQRAISRMLVRSGLPIAYSEGFNPHPRLNIALPLSIYQEGERELFDFRVDGDIALDEIFDKLKKSAFPGMDIVEVSFAQGKLTTKRAVWRLEVKTDLTPDEFASAFDGEMLVTKRSKKGEKDVDIAPLIRFISAVKNDTSDGLTVHVDLPAEGNNYLNPAYIAAFFGDKLKMMRVVRENILF